jgi:TPR repeat protein
MNRDLIFLSINNAVCGPFELAVVMHMLETNEITKKTQAQFAGANYWITIDDIVVSQTTTFKEDGEKCVLVKPTSSKIKNYSEILFYQKQGFFWFTYFLIPPIALLLLIFSDIYYLRKGILKKFGIANKVLAISILIGISYAIIHESRQLRALPSDKVATSIPASSKPLVAAASLPALPSDNISTRAIKLYQDASKGDISSITDLALIYSEGIEVAPNKDLGRKLLKIAVEKNDPVAQATLGYDYLKGEGVEVNLTEAAKLFQLAADQGDVDAQNNLGNMCYFGHGIPQNLAKAALLYEKAAKQNDLNATAMFGIMLLHGEGVAKDENKALRNLIYSADKGHTLAQYNLGCLYLSGGSEVNQSTERAVELLKKASERKLPDALYKLGSLYETGDLVARNLEEASECYHQIISNDSDLAPLALARVYQKGMRVEKNESKAIEFYEQAAAQGITEAKIQLSIIYYSRTGKDKDVDKAVGLIKQAVDDRSSFAMILLGLLYLNGEVDVDYSFQTDTNWEINKKLKGPHSLIDRLKAAISAASSLCKQITEAYPRGKPGQLSGHEGLVQNMAWVAAEELVKIITQIKDDKSIQVNQHLIEALDVFLKTASSQIGYNEFLVLSSLTKLSERIQKIESDLIIPKQSQKDSVLNETEPSTSPLVRSVEIANAIELFKMAIHKSNSSTANFNLGLMVKDGIGFPADPGKAIELLEHSARQGYTSAMLLLGSMYQSGDGVSKDQEKAIKYYYDAAERKDPLAYLHLGLMFEFGQGSMQNLERAREFYEKAANIGIPEASEGLKRLMPETNN